MTRWYVNPYKMASEGGIALADGLDALRIRQQGSTYTPQEGDIIVNWGCGGPLRNFSPATVINPSVDVCINKVTFFRRMQGHNIVPPFAFSADEALRHLAFPIICRTRIEGADGQGIVIANNAEEMASARLYTQLMDKSGEYRVHLGRLPDGTIELICAQKKRVASVHEGPIWTGEHTYLDWCDPSYLPRHVFDVTKRAMELMPELHFGGFDTIVTDSWGARVVEVNSAPMMTPDTVRKYVDFLKRFEQPVVVAGAEEDPTETADYQAGYADGRREALDEMLGQLRSLQTGSN